METFTKEAKRIGKFSLGVIIPKDIVKQMELKPRRRIKVTIKFANDNMCDYMCKACKHFFASSDAVPFCSACGCEDLEELTE